MNKVEIANSEDRSLGYLISDAARLMRTVFDRRVRRLGLTRAQWLVLARLHRHPGASQSDLADMMEVEKASAGRMVDRLERKGWIERRSDPDDRRINRLYLTPDAERISKRMRSVADGTVNDALSDLSGPQADQLAALLTVVKTRLVTLAALPDQDARPHLALVKKRSKKTTQRAAADAHATDTREAADTPPDGAGMNAARSAP